MTESHITPEELSPEAIDPETEANESRKARTQARADENRGVVGVVEDVVSSFTRPLAADPPDADERERQRELNDREQRA